jgi:hypothetical protein
MNAFGIVVIVVGVSSAVISLVLFARSARLYREVGRLGERWMVHDEDELGDAVEDRLTEDERQLRAAVTAARRRHRASPPSSHTAP